MDKLVGALLVLLGLMVVDIPPRLLRRPRHGVLPVPYTVQWVDGVPDFRINDIEAWARGAKRRLCGLCGEQLTSKIWFIGGEVSVLQTHLFSDLPMHEECARYAAQVCPYLAGGREYRLGRLPEGVVEYGGVSDHRPNHLFLAACYGYELVGRLEVMLAGKTEPRLRAHRFTYIEEIGGPLKTGVPEEQES